jgi:hypothetical protein
METQSIEHSSPRDSSSRAENRADLARVLTALALLACLASFDAPDEHPSAQGISAAGFR